MKLSIEDITTQLSHINTLISQEISESDYPTMLSYLNELSAWQGNSGKCVADAEWYYHEELEKVFDELDKKGNLKDVPATVLNNLAKAKCKEFIYLLKLAERYNRGIVHRCDSIRSILSFAKAEMSNR
jgi:hypothetical protein